MKVSAMKVSADLLESAEGFSKPGGGPDLIAPQSDSRGENLVLLKVFHGCRCAEGFSSSAEGFSRAC